MEVIQGQIQGQGQSKGRDQVKKGHHIQKSHSGHVIHVLWPILAMEFDGHVLVWSYEVTFRSCQRRSGHGQVKKGQIVKFINVDKKGAYVDQFLPRNLIVSFVFT